MQAISLRDTLLYESNIHLAVECFASCGNGRFTVLSEKKCGVVVAQSEDRGRWGMIALRVAQVVLFPITLVALLLKGLWRAENIANVDLEKAIGVIDCVKGALLELEIQRACRGHEKKLASIKLIQSVFSEIRPCQHGVFLSSICGVYQEMMNKESSHEIALKESLIAGISVLLQTESEEDEEALMPYICVIQQTLVGVDSVYLRINAQGIPYERYHRASIEEWVRRRGTDPMTKEARSLGDIKTDRGAIREVCAILDERTASFQEIDFSSFPDLVSDQGLLDVVKKTYEKIRVKYQADAKDSSIEAIRREINLCVKF